MQAVKGGGWGAGPSLWTGQQQQEGDDWQIWGRDGKLRRAKGRRGSREIGLQVREGGPAGRTENM